MTSRTVSLMALLTSLSPCGVMVFTTPGGMERGRRRRKARSREGEIWGEGGRKEERERLGEGKRGGKDKRDKQVRFTAHHP